MKNGRNKRIVIWLAILALLAGCSDAEEKRFDERSVTSIAEQISEVPPPQPAEESNGLEAQIPVGADSAEASGAESRQPEPVKPTEPTDSEAPTEPEETDESRSTRPAEALPPQPAEEPSVSEPQAPVQTEPIEVSEPEPPQPEPEKPPAEPEPEESRPAEPAASDPPASAVPPVVTDPPEAAEPDSEAFTEADHQRIIAEVRAYAERFAERGFTFAWQESMEFGWEVGWMGTPRVKYEGVDGVIEMLQYHIDLIYQTSTDPQYGAAASYMTYKVVQLTVDGDLAYAVIYGG